MGHGGHGDLSMAAMVADMRRRFLVAVVFSVPILLWSAIGRDVLGFEVPAPLGLRDDVFQLLLSLPVIFWASWIFFDGALRALRARTLDMMVLVAVAIGTGWTYSLVVTLTGGGEVFYEAATVLAAFVFEGGWTTNPRAEQLLRYVVDPFGILPRAWPCRGPQPERPGWSHGGKRADGPSWGHLARTYLRANGRGVDN